MARVRWWGSLGLAAWLTGCGGDPVESPADTVDSVEVVALFEGDEEGECSDGADNDRDALFDCDDSDCAGAPVCAPPVNVCEDAADLIDAAVTACGIAPRDATDPIDCTPANAALFTCMARCYDDVTCGAINGADADGALGLAMCVGACVSPEDTPPEPDTTGDSADTGGWPFVAGFRVYAYFGYDDLIDIARPYTDTTPADPHLTFLFFDQNYQTTGDIADGCLFTLYAPQLPRASWADAGQPYLFGWEIDPADRSVYRVSNCDAHYGPGAADFLFDDIVDTGRWGVGVSADIDPAVVQALYTGFYDPSDYLGAAITTTSTVVPVPSWEGYSAATVVDAAWDISPGGAAPVQLAGADAVRDRSSPSIPTLQTPVRARYFVSSTTLWVFQ